MTYYRGDGSNYSGGGYYRGDPFLGGLLSKALPKVAAWVGGRVGGSKGRAAIGGALGVAVAQKIPVIKVPGTGISISPGNFLPGGEPLFERTQEKKKYRKMNPLNPRALRRALRRAEGFEKFAVRTVNALYKNVGGSRKRVFKKC